MSGDVDVRPYFMRNAEPVKGVTIRAINALMRGGIMTMGDLARAAPEDIVATAISA
jgi:hypothetical protein